MTHFRPILDWYPLTLAQLDFWEEFRAHPGVAVSTVAHATRITGGIDAAALAQAITRTLNETDVLALRFCDGPEGPRQTIDPARVPQLRLIDLRDHADPQAAADALMQEDLHRPLDLTADPLSAQWLLHIADDCRIWYCRGHHIFLDGYAMALIERRVAQLYTHLTQGADAGTPFAPFHHYLDEESAYRAGPRHAAAGEFWREQLASGPELPILRKGSEDYPATPLWAEIGLQELAEPLRHMAARLQLGLADLLTLLSGIWLWHHPCCEGQEPQEARVLWLPFMSRFGSVSAAIPAMVVNILPFRVAPDPALDLDRNLTDLGRALRRLRRHGRYRIEQITADRGLDSKHRFFFSPLVNVMPFDQPAIAGCGLQREVLAAGPADGFNITFACDSRGDGLVLHLEADPVMTPQARFAFHRDGFPEFLRRCAAQEPGMPLARALS